MKNLKKAVSGVLALILTISCLGSIRLQAGYGESNFELEGYADAYSLEVEEFTFREAEGLRVVGGININEIMRGQLTETGFEGFVMIEDGLYAMEIETIYGIEYLLVGKFQLELTDEIAVASALQRNDLTSGIREDILSLLEDVHEGRVFYGLTMTVFCQSLLSYSSMLRGVQIITYNGMPMRTTTTHITLRSTGMHFIQFGPNSRNVAQSLFNIAFSVSGQFNRLLSLTGTANSVWHSINNMINPPRHVVTSPGDYLQIGMRFNETRRRTYGTSFGQWVLGLTTHQIAVTHVDHRHHFMVNGRGQNFHFSWMPPVSSSFFMSPNFDNPWSLAQQRMAGLRPPGHLFQAVQYRIHHTTFDFR